MGNEMLVRIENDGILTGWMKTKRVCRGDDENFNNNEIKLLLIKKNEKEKKNKKIIVGGKNERKRMGGGGREANKDLENKRELKFPSLPSSTFIKKDFLGTLWIYFNFSSF